MIHDSNIGHLNRYDLESLEAKFGLTAVKVYYTGHVLKVIWVLVSRLIIGESRKSLSLDFLFEEIDKKFEDKKYGASNMIVVFRNK